MSTANIIPTRQSAEHPDVTTQRRADALAEINKLNTEHMLAVDALASAKRDIDRLNDRVAMLIDDNTEHKIQKNIYHRKMIELATTGASIGMLCRKFEEIMMTVGELLDKETEQQKEAEQKSAAAAVANLPQSQDRPKPTLATVADQVERDLGNMNGLPAGV